MNRWALVTGAAKRIGREIALELARGGYDIVVHYKASRHEAIQTAEDVRALGREACVVELDLADLQLVKKVIPTLIAELGVLKVLVNNAALFLPDKLDRENLQKKVNITAPKILGEVFSQQHKNGVIINLLDSDPPRTGFSHYSKSKKALADLTLQQALRFAPRHRVNGVALGSVLPSARQSPQHFRQLVRATPLKKPVAPQDVAKALRFLIDNASVTGSILAVDGGMHLLR